MSYGRERNGRGEGVRGEGSGDGSGGGLESGRWAEQTPFATSQLTWRHLAPGPLSFPSLPCVSTPITLLNVRFAPSSSLAAELLWRFCGRLSTYL